MKKYQKLTGLVLAVLISVLVFVFRKSFVQLEGYGYLGIFLISILGNATIILPVPVFLTAFIGGSIFNPFLVALVVSVGSAIGELTGYLAGTSGRVVVEKSERLKKVYQWMHKYGLWVVFFLAAIPNFIFDLAGIVSGATKIPVWKFLTVTWVGKFVRFLGIAYLGASLGWGLTK